MNDVAKESSSMAESLSLRTMRERWGEMLTRVQEELDGATQQQLAHCTYRSSRCVCGMCRWTTGMDAATRAGARVLNNLVNHLATQGDTESA